MVTIPASWMRGGTSKGVFFLKKDLPDDVTERDSSLLKVIGSPDPFSKQIDGLGGATSSTSKVVIIDKSTKAECDVDYLFGHVSITDPVIDYSGNCGNLTAAVGVFAIEQGLVDNVITPVTPVKVWQVNLKQHIVVHVPVDAAGNVIYTGDTVIAGVPGSGAPIQIDFIKPGREDGSVLPTGAITEQLQVEGIGEITVSLVQAGNATVFVNMDTLGISGEESYAEINSNDALLTRVEAIRCAAAVKMGMAASIEAAKAQPSTPKLAYVAKPRSYETTSGQLIDASNMDLYARIFSMGKLHHAFTGTGAVAIAVAANIPGSVVASALADPTDNIEMIRIGHTAGVMECSADTTLEENKWMATTGSLVRTARLLMRGEVFIDK